MISALRGALIIDSPNDPIRKEFPYKRDLDSTAKCNGECLASIVEDFLRGQKAKALPGHSASRPLPVPADGSVGSRSGAPACRAAWCVS